MFPFFFLLVFFVGSLFSSKDNDIPACVAFPFPYIAISDTDTDFNVNLAGPNLCVPIYSGYDFPTREFHLLTSVFTLAPVAEYGM